MPDQQRAAATMPDLNRTVVFLLLAACPQYGRSLPADDTQPNRRAAQTQGVQEQREDPWRRLNETTATSYEIFTGDEAKRRLDLHEESILRWSNPVTGAIYGDVYLWTLEQRPLAIASFYQYDTENRYVGVAFHSLSNGALSAVQRGVEVWSPKAPGVRFQLLQDASAPESSESLRLVQMRTLAREFRVRFTTPEDDQEWLRLLPQPSYRYRCESAGVLDGGLFIYAQGTNPEAVLMLEVQRTPTGDKWHFAMARQTAYQLEGIRNEKTVWTAPMAFDGRTNDRTQPYTVFAQYAEPGTE